MKDHLIIGSRGSRLAIAQSEIVKTLLLSHFPNLQIDIQKIQTSGDKLHAEKIYKFGGKGVFVKEIEEALLSNSIDLAVHSMKDVPTDIPQALEISSVLKREDASDAFLSVTYERLEDMPKGSRIGSSSLRRHVQILERNPNVDVCDLRGNVDTRLKKLKAGEMDAMVMATCGLKRLNLEQEIRQSLNFVPAVGQGAIGIEIRKDDKKVKDKILRLNDEKTYNEVFLERIFLKKMNGGCLLPLGAKVFCSSQDFSFETFIGSLDTQVILKHKGKGKIIEGEKTISEVCEKILNEGGREILRSVERGFKNI